MGIIRCPSAWIGEDHILLIGGTRFGETYQRVYFRDLQALVIRRKPRFVMQWPYLLLLPFIPVVAFGSVFTAAFPILFVTVLSVIAIVALVSGRFGCYLDLATAVGNVPVRSVAFMWTARRFSAKVAPLIIAAQTPPSPPEAT